MTRSVPVLAALAGLLATARAPAAVILSGPDFKSVADHVHALTVQVRGHAFVAGRDDGGHLRVSEGSSAASGVLLGSGFALTDLSSVTMAGKEGELEPVAGIEVSIPDVGTVPAQVVDVDPDLGVAILRLPDETRELPGAILAAQERGENDAYIAIGADGTRVTALPVLAGHAGGDGSRLAIDRSLPDLFRGGPLFDGQGHLVGLIVGASAAVPVSRLRPLLERLLRSDGI